MFSVWFVCGLKWTFFLKAVNVLRDVGLIKPFLFIYYYLSLNLLFTYCNRFINGLMVQKLQDIKKRILTNYVVLCRLNCKSARVFGRVMWTWILNFKTVKVHIMYFSL